jgi:hypothetical protein
MRVSEVLDRVPGERLDSFANRLLSSAQSLRDSNIINRKESDIKYAHNLLAITSRLLNVCNKNINTKKDSDSNRKAIDMSGNIYCTVRHRSFNIGRSQK